MPGRNPFTDKEDQHLIAYIAKENPGLANRSGNKLYQKLEENSEGKWPWSKTHPWQSWRERYKQHQDTFDRKIRRYQKKHDIQVPEGSPSKRKRIDKDEGEKRKEKRVKLEDDRERDSARKELARKKRVAKREEEEENSQDIAAQALKKRREDDNAIKKRAAKSDEKGESGRAPAIAQGLAKRQTTSDKSRIALEKKAVKNELEGPVRLPEPPRKPTIYAARKVVGGGVRTNVPKPVEPVALPPAKVEHVVEGGEDNDDDEATPGLVDSEDYQGDIFGESASEADEAGAENEDEDELAAEVDAILTDTGDMSDGEPEQSQLPERDPTPQPENHQRLYPDLETLRSPIPPSDEDHHIPGSFDTPKMAPKEDGNDTLGALDLSQEPTPPVSGIDDIPDTIEPRIALHKKDPPVSQDKANRKPTSSNTASIRPASYIPKLQDTQNKPPVDQKTADILLGRPVIAPRFKRKKMESEDPFGPSPPTPTSEEEPRRLSGKRKLPMLVEGAFGSAFKGTKRRANDTDTESDSDGPKVIEKPAMVWPPVRRKANSSKPKGIAMLWGAAEIVKESAKSDTQVKGKEAAKAAEQVVYEKMPSKVKEPIKDAVTHKEVSETSGAKSLNSTKSPMKRMGGIEVNAVASTSKTMLPPKETSHRTLFGATSSKEVSAASKVPTEQRKQKVWQEEELTTPDDSTLIEPEVDSPTKRVAAVLGRDSIGTNSPVSGKVLPERTEKKAPIRPVPVVFSTDSFKPPPPQSPLSDDPFVDSAYKAKKGKECVKVPVERQAPQENAPEPVFPRIDLESALKRQSHLSSVSSASRPIRPKPQTTNTGRTFSVLSLPQDELDEIRTLGMISKLSKTHGFGEEVVSNVFKLFGNMHDTEQVILGMKLYAEQFALAKYKELKGTDDDDEDEDEQQNEQDGAEEQEDVPESSPSRPKKSRHRAKQAEQLQIKPLDEVEDDETSDNYPASSSRAGKFARLVKQGREIEALKREKRASLGSSILRHGRSLFTQEEESPTKRRMGDTPAKALRLPSPLPPSSPPRDESPTKKRAGDIPAKALRPPLSLPPSSPPPEEPEELEPPRRVVELTEEQKEMFANANDENIDTLRELEKTVDQEALLKWFVGHMMLLAVKPEPED